MLRAGIDVGGTFTDVVVVDEDGTNIEIRKVPTTRDQSEGILRGLATVAPRIDSFAEICHGTTVATNILLEGNGARTGLITTKGFRDAVEIGRGRRLVPGSIFDLHFVRPRPLTPREHRLEVREKIAASGEVIVPLDREEVAEAARRLGALEVEAVAICFINSYVSADHEQQAKAIVEEALPGVFVCCSSEIVPQIREYERFSTATVNCFVAPAMARYMTSLRNGLSAGRYRHDVLTMASNAGLLSTEAAISQPVRTVLSGPAAAASGAAYIGSVTDRPQLITYDMGGTSTDVCLIDGGEPLFAFETVHGGIPISVPQLDIHTVGTGGGSIAWIDVDGRPKIGPRSARAEPGPISIGKGGTEITVTDANLLLGRLPEQILDGAVRLRVAPVITAFDRFRAELAVAGTREDVAEGLIRLAVSSMAGSVRKISVERGHDPRDFSLFAIGGAGPMHAALVAEELEIGEVIVPPMPGNVAALGHLVGDLKHELVRNFRATIEGFAESGGGGILSELGQAVRDRLASEGTKPDAITVRYLADLRYVGQSYELAVPLQLPYSAAAVEKAFRALYHRRYGHEHAKVIEFTSLKAIGLGERRARIVLAAPLSAEEEPTTVRDAYFGGRWHEARVVRRGGLAVATAVPGPAIIEEYGATTVVPPGWSARLGVAGCLFLTREARG